MKEGIIFISIQIFLVCSSSIPAILPSEEIWINVKSNIAQNLIVYNKNYFIYDERNYTKLDIYGEKMKALNKKQYETFNRNSYLSNYIFIIESLDETRQSLINVAEKLSENIKLEIDYYDKHNYIIAVFVIQSRKVKFYAGTTAIKKITKNKMDKILKDIKYYMRNEEYYDAWTKVIEDYDYYYNDNTNYNKSEKSSSLIWLWIALGVVAFFIIVTIISIKFGCCSSSSSGYHNYTKSYYRDSDNDNRYCYYRDNDNRVSYVRDIYNNNRYSYNNNRDSYNNNRDSYDNNRDSYNNNSYGGRDSYDNNSYGGRDSVASGGSGGSW